MQCASCHQDDNLVDGGMVLIQLRFRNMSFIFQSFTSRQFTLGLGEGCLPAANVRLTLQYGRPGHFYVCHMLSDARFERARVEARYELILLNEVVEICMKVGNLARKLGAHDNRIECFERSRCDNHAFDIPSGYIFE